ncbi:MULTISPECIES: ankyrin repeat domain-containing protein [unclassified Aureispira]|uniref:ankyrin repeat domain-containing protein n=1 Tax=unclassified Aureispira TaxID=2649989 RepID=UPI000696D09C|nr:MULTISPECIES: ankyrin repeat domain-containing protein [unclassified Aureispira]WMX15091.1 ankyrin repeat domain-containing protein [Aureispira sp. CCB-E]
MIQVLKSHSKNKDTDKVISLIHSNPEILNFRDYYGSSGLMIIAYNQLDKALEQALALKKTLSFHEAIVCGKIDAVKEHLRQYKSKGINALSQDGYPPLCLAALFHQTEIAKLLIEYGADVNLAAKNVSRVTPLQSAVAKENYELCTILLKAGANPNIAQMQNATALHSAVYRGNLALTKLLVENGAFITTKMYTGETAMSIAENKGYQEIKDYLLAAQADA